MTPEVVLCPPLHTYPHTHEHVCTHTHTHFQKESLAIFVYDIQCMYKVYIFMVCHIYGVHLYQYIIKHTILPPSHIIIRQHLGLGLQTYIHLHVSGTVANPLQRWCTWTLKDKVVFTWQELLVYMHVHTACSCSVVTLSAALIDVMPSGFPTALGFSLPFEN